MGDSWLTLHTLGHQVWDKWRKRCWDYQKVKGRAWVLGRWGCTTVPPSPSVGRDALWGCIWGGGAEAALK